MRRLTLIITALFFTISAFTQVRQDVITSAGGYSVSSGISLSWTLGETIIPTFTKPDIILTHGFQQQMIVIAVEENLESRVRVTLFPNPANENVNIIFEQPALTEMQLMIFNSTGNLVKSDVVEPAMNEKQVNLQDLPAGIYFLRLVKGKLCNIYKVVKL